MKESTPSRMKMLGKVYRKESTKKTGELNNVILPFTHTLLEVTGSISDF